MEAKNVCLPLVDHHEDLRSGGIVQLFLKPRMEISLFSDSLVHFLHSDPARFLSSTRPMTENPVSISASHRPTIHDEEQARKIRYCISPEKLFSYTSLSFISAPTITSTRSNDSGLLASELNDTLSYLDSIEQLLLLTSTSFSQLPTASFNNRVSFNQLKTSLSKKILAEFLVGEIYVEIFEYL